MQPDHPSHRRHAVAVQDEQHVVAGRRQGLWLGSFTLTEVLVRVNVSHMNRWLASKAWVTEPMAMRLTFVIAAAFGVFTVMGRRSTARPARS